QVFADMALLLFAQRAAQGHQLIEQVFDIAAAAVVGLDQLLKLFLEVRASLVQANQLIELAALRTSRSVFLCLESLKRARSASKSIFDKSITGAGLAGMSTPVIEVSSNLPMSPIMSVM